MATVAQTYLEKGLPAPMSSPDNRKHIWQSHVAIVTSLQDENCSRYVFEQPPADTVGKLYQAKALTSRQWAKNIQLPSDPIWIEYPILEAEERTKMAVYIATCDVVIKDVNNLVVRDEVMLCFNFVMKNDHVCHVFGVLATPLPPFDTRDSFEMITLAWPTDDGLDDLEVTKAYLRDALDCLFVLTIPKVCEIRKVQHPPKLQAARKRRGKVPLIQFQQVTILIDKPTVRYAKGAGGPGDGVRGSPAYHAVEGHFRTYHREKDDEYIRWVPKFWRGDVSKGIILKERHIKASMEAKE